MTWPNLRLPASGPVQALARVSFSAGFLPGLPAAGLAAGVPLPDLAGPGATPLATGAAGLGGAAPGLAGGAAGFLAGGFGLFGVGVAIVRSRVRGVRVGL